MEGFDWSLLRSFVAVAEEGSLSGAARVLGGSQPTLGRHVEALEESLGVTLFARHSRGLELTGQGAELYELAVKVRQGVDAFARRAEGLDARVEGTVRVSASEVVAIYVLPGIIAGMRREHPGLEVEVVADDGTANLLRRDADVAVRMYRPTQRGVLARKVGEARLSLYATREYLERVGPLEVLEDLSSQHTLIGFDRGDLWERALEGTGVVLERGAFAVRCDAQAFHAQAVAAGVGAGAVLDALAVRMGGMERVFGGFELPPLPVWLVSHPDLRRSPRVRTAYDMLAAGLGAYFAPTGEGASEEGA